MAELNQFELQYAIRTYITSTLADGGIGADSAGFNSATADADAFENDGSIGIDTNKFGLQLTNQPTFDPGQAIIDQRKSIGVSYRRGDTGYEYQQGVRLPTTTWEFDVTKQNLPLFVWLLFQKGVSEAAGTPFVKTCVPYAEGSEEVEVVAALLKKMSTGSADSHMIGGSIVRSMTLSANEGEALKASVEMIGYNMVTDFDFDADNNIIEYDNSAPLLWQNASVKLATTSVNIPGFSVTISNNATAKFYDSQHPIKYVLNDFTAEGTFQVPWSMATVGGNAQLDNFVAGTTVLLEIWWGNESPSADGDVKLQLICRYTGAPQVGEDEVLTELPFQCVHDGSNDNIKLYLADGLDRTIP